MNENEVDKLVDLIKDVANRTHTIKPVFNFYGDGKLWNGNRIQFEVDWLNDKFFAEIEKNGWRFAWVRSMAYDKIVVTLEKFTPIPSEIELTKEMRENIASLEHEQWIHWSKEVGTELKALYTLLIEGKNQAVINALSARLKRWESYWTPYEELDEPTKEFDRVWANRTLDILRMYHCANKEIEPTQKLMRLNAKGLDDIQMDLIRDVRQMIKCVEQFSIRKGGIHLNEHIAKIQSNIIQTIGIPAKITEENRTEDKK